MWGEKGIKEGGKREETKRMEWQHDMRI